MPPARTIIRSEQTFNSVADFTTPTDYKNVYKPYNPLPARNRSRPKEKNSCKISTSPERSDPPKYMDLNEFFQNVDKNDSDSYNECDPDYPKPTVDLLASLLTLGKMIQNQKQLIQNQTEHNNQTTSTCNSYPSSHNNYPESNVNTPIEEQRPVDLESTYLGSEDNEENFQRYIPKKTSSTSSSSPLSKRRVIPEDIKDIDYWDRRKRNNLAAKKSREERRKKELEVVDTTKQLEKENSQLTIMLKRLTSRNEWLESRLQNMRCRQRTDASVESSSLSSEES